MRYSVSFALLLGLSVPVTAGDPKVEEFAPHAAGVALVEVKKVEKFDERSTDGNKGVRFKLKLVRGSGAVYDTVEVVTEFGGFRGGEVPKPSAPLKPDSLKKGDRVWFAFSSDHEWEKYTQGVIGFWPEKDAKAEALDAAVKAGAYRWRPQYEPKLKLAVGHLVEKDKWRVRAERDGKALWEKELPGKPTGPYAFGLSLSPGTDLEVPTPKCGQYLVAETATRLGKDNEFGLPAGPYWINTGFDPETGKKLAVWVRVPQESHVALVDRRYDPDTGKVQFEQRYDFLKAGGKAAGAKTEDWYRRTERTFDAAGKVTKEEVLRYDEDAEAGKRWVKVRN